MVAAGLETVIPVAGAPAITETRLLILPGAPFWLAPARLDRMGTCLEAAPMATEAAPTVMNWIPSGVVMMVASGMVKAETTTGEKLKSS